MAEYVLVCSEPILPSGTCSGTTNWIAYEQPVSNPLTELDIDVAMQVDGVLLTTFFSGHILGRFLKWLGRK